MFRRLSACLFLLAACNPGEVAETFNDERALDIAPPPAALGEARKGALIVRIDENNALTIDGASITLEDLPGKLQALKQSGVQPDITIRAHLEAKNGILLAIREVAAEAEIETINIVLDVGPEPVDLLQPLDPPVLGTVGD